MRFIDSDTISCAATATEWVNAMEEAIVMSITDNYLMPKRMHIDRGNDTFLLMPCITDEYWVTKLVSFCPGNPSIDLPSIYGTIVLNSTKTGEPLAVMDGSKITAFRTAAVSAMGIKYLSKDDAKTLGVVGTGVQGISQAIFACSVRKIEELTVFDHSERSVSRFLEVFGKEFPEIRVNVAEKSEEVCSRSEIIITATNTKEPIFPGKEELFEGKTFIAIGSYKPECREYPGEFFNTIDQIFIDTIHGLKESGDLIYPVEEGLIAEDKIYSLGALLRGDISLSDKPTRFFKTVGSAIFDLYAAKLVFEKSSGADQHKIK
jgi:ornithine cyclodeaminase/alanine dehydrogenase-like protein (mu-crystallin family)